jgi:UDP-N-acetylglucosamine acyltransferase
MTIDPTATIHPSAFVEPGADIGPGVRIGPFSLIGADATLAAGVEVKSHAVITGQTEIGADSVIFPFVTLGEVPQRAAAV